MPVLDAQDASAVYGAMSRADKLDISLIEAALGGTRVLWGCAVTAHAGTPNMTVDMAAGAIMIAGAEIEVAAQTSAAIVTLGGGTDGWALVEVDTAAAIHVNNTSSGASSGSTAPPAPTAGRIVVAAIYLPDATVTIIDATTTSGRGKILDRRETMGFAESAYKMRATATVQEDFFSGNLTSGQIGQYGWNLASSIGVPVVTAQDNLAGVLRLSTGANAAGYNSLMLGTTATPGAALAEAGHDFVCEWLIQKISISAVGTQENKGWWGVHDGAQNVEPSNGYYFFQDKNNTNYQCKVVTAGTATTVDSGIAQTAASAIRFRIARVGATVTFYINDALVATITTNLPGNTHLVSPGAAIVKTLGATAHTMDLDYCYLAYSVSR